MPKRKQQKEKVEFRYSERITVRQGDTFRARGGPTYNGMRVGYPGLYKMLDVETQRKRVYLLAYPVDRHGIQSGGIVLLYVIGKPYKLKGFENWVVRPYKISKPRVTK